MSDHVSKYHEGKIIKCDYKQNNLVGYYIEDDLDKTKHYFAHLGDLLENEKLLYDLRDGKGLGNYKFHAYKPGDKVKFCVFEKWDAPNLAIKVDKISE